MANNTAAVFTRHYDSPMGGILLAADEIGLRGLWFDGQKYFARDLPEKRIEQETQALAEARRWLDVYFTGKEPDFLPPLHPIGLAFRQAVWTILLQIPYGQTATYGEIARQLAGTAGLSRMSAQAVGGAVGHNEIDHHSLPPRCRHKRQSDRVRRRDRKKSEAAGTGTGRYDRIFCAEERYGTVTGP